MRDLPHLPATQEQPFLLIFLGGLGVVGTAASALAVAVASLVVPDHDWMSETISDMAAGPLKILTDCALYGFAAALVATGMAASHAHLGGARWSVGTVSLGILAAIVTIIAARDEYGDGDTVGVTVHAELVYALGVLFLVAMITMAPGAAHHSQRLRRTLLTLGFAWAVSAPIFFFVPTSIDGLFERGVGLIAAAFVICLGWTFLRRGLARR